MGLSIFHKSVVVGVVAIFLDFLGHLLLSEPLETFPYFGAKFAFLVVFSMVFFFRNTEKIFGVKKLLIHGVIFAFIFGFYYNVLPLVIPGFVPFGIPLNQLFFLGSNDFLHTGLGFGALHVVSFVGGVKALRFFSR